VLFASGYQDTDRFRDSLLETGAAVLGKPFDIAVPHEIVRWRLGGT
jgi:hypothetical protein